MEIAPETHDSLKTSGASGINKLSKPPVEIISSFGVIDIGSNTVRLVIYACEGPLARTIFNEKVSAGLGRDLASSKRLHPEGKLLAFQALARFQQIVTAYPSTQVIAVATAAMREAEDGPDFVKDIKEKLGLDIKVLSGTEEALYTAQGALSGLPNAKGIVADMGGASLELAALNAQAPNPLSMNLGPLILASLFSEDITSAAKHVQKTLKAAKKAYTDYDTLIVVGGAWRLIAKLHMEDHDYPLAILQGYELRQQDLLAYLDIILSSKDDLLSEFRHRAGKRGEVLLHSVTAMKELLLTFDFKTIVFSAHGLREGILTDKIGAISGIDLASNTVTDTRYRQRNIEARRKLALLLKNGFRGLIPWLAEENNLNAAIIYSNCGDDMHPSHRGFMAAERAVYDELPGFNHKDRVFLAMTIAARYGERQLPPYSALLDADTAQDAYRLGRVIRFMSKLSGGKYTLLEKLDIKASQTELQLKFPQQLDPLMSEGVKKHFYQLAREFGLTGIIASG